jgi:hypothetical protein
MSTYSYPRVALAFFVMALTAGCASEVDDAAIRQDEPICSKHGEQAECADGSVCVDGECWIACEPSDPAACRGLPFRYCRTFAFIDGPSPAVCQEEQ